MKSAPIVFLFNSPLQSGCDYVVQTMKIMVATNPSYGLALGDILWFPKLLAESDPWIVRRVHGAVIVRPLSLIPGVRFRPVRMLGYFLNSVLLRMIVALKHPASPKVLWFFEPFHLSSLLPVFSGYRTLYDCVDYYPAFNPLAAKEHAIVLDRATYVAANSQPLYFLLRRVRRDTKRVPLGCASDIFSSKRIRPILPGRTHFIVGYVGGISDRIDFESLLYVIKRMPNITFRFAGPIEKNVFGAADEAYRRFAALRKLPNVEYVGAIDKMRIPEFLASIHAGIIPYREDLPFNTRSFPMKTLEYFAAGRPVVATNISALRRYAKNGLVKIASTGDAMETAIVAIQRRGWPSRDQQRQYKEALGQRWEQKITAIRTVFPRLTP